MEETKDKLQKKLINAMLHTELIILAAEDLSQFLNLNKVFYQDLAITNATAKDLSQRIMNAQDIDCLEQYSLVTEQVRIMASDLIDTCKQNMPSV